MKKMRSRIILLSASAVILLGLTIALLLSPSLRETVLRPILEAWLSTRYKLSYVSERVQWTVIIGIGFLALLEMIFQRTPPEWHPRATFRRTRFANQGPVIDLDQLLARSERSRFAQERAVLELRDLAARVLASRGQLTLDEAKERIADGTWTQNARARAILEKDPTEKRLSRNRRFLSDVEHVLATIERMHQEV